MRRGRGLRAILADFMIGRYGADNLYHFLNVLCFVFIFINVFAESIFISMIEFLLLFFSFFRFFSRNIYKRQRENERFLKIMEKPREFFKMAKVRQRDRKTHVFRKCPSCKNNLRLPKSRGKHTVVCPCCKNRFDVKI